MHKMGTTLTQCEVLEVFRKQPERTFRIRDLVRELGLRSSQAHELKHVLNDLSNGRKIRESKKSHFTLALQQSHGKETDHRAWRKGEKGQSRGEEKHRPSVNTVRLALRPSQAIATS